MFNYCSALLLLVSSCLISTTASAHQRECPRFKRVYNSCEIRFGRPDFRIDSFSVRRQGNRQFFIAAESNQGQLPFSVTADRVVRLGRDQRVNEDGSVEFFSTHESSFCEGNKIVGQQMVLLPNSEYEIQVLEFISEGEDFIFKLTTNGEPRADVLCRP